LGLKEVAGNHCRCPLKRENGLGGVIDTSVLVAGIGGLKFRETNPKNAKSFWVQ
jgi:hypothetical protein